MINLVSFGAKISRIDQAAHDLKKGRSINVTELMLENPYLSGVNRTQTIKQNNKKIKGLSFDVATSAIRAIFGHLGDKAMQSKLLRPCLSKLTRGCSKLAQHCRNALNEAISNGFIKRIG